MAWGSAQYTCGKCGGSVSKNAGRCPHCGVLLSGIRCTSCGFTGSERDFAGDRCPKCGSFVQVDRPPATPSGVKCMNCGFTGSKWDFAGDQCPRCRSIVQVSRWTATPEAAPKAVPEARDETCKTCGQAIKASDWTCPHCGHTRWTLIALLGAASLACLGSALYAALPTVEMGPAEYACWGIGGLGGAILLLVTVSEIVTALKARRK